VTTGLDLAAVSPIAWGGLALLWATVGLYAVAAREAAPVGTDSSILFALALAGIFGAGQFFTEGTTAVLFVWALAIGAWLAGYLADA